MNWFENRPVPRDRNSPQVEDVCEHVETDWGKAYTMMCEVDSFGLVGSRVVCSACFDKAEQEEGECEIVCQCCKQRVLKKNSREWRWYDFYAAQGDEALVLCLECWKAPAHQARMAQDRKEAHQEDRYHDLIRQGYLPTQASNIAYRDESDYEDEDEYAVCRNGLKEGCTCLYCQANKEELEAWRKMEF